MRRHAVVVGLVAAAVALLVWAGVAGGPRSAPSPAPAARDAAWAALDAQARCEAVLPLVTHRDRWPTECRWRQPGERLQGQAFPPPEGPPPYDRPRVEIYVDQSQTREQLGHAVAHEYGHMHHTRAFDFVADWLAARGLPPTTPSEVWTEDYAEVFAALFGPPVEGWRAPTSRPTPEALATLKDRFFAA